MTTRLPLFLLPLACIFAPMQAAAGGGGGAQTHLVDRSRSFRLSHLSLPAYETRRQAGDRGWMEGEGNKRERERERADENLLLLDPCLPRISLAAAIHQSPHHARSLLLCRCLIPHSILRTRRAIRPSVRPSRPHVCASTPAFTEDYSSTYSMVRLILPRSPKEWRPLACQSHHVLNSYGPEYGYGHGRRKNEELHADVIT